MILRDVMFLPLKIVHAPHFLQIVAEVKTMRLPHVLKLWLWVSKGMLPV